MALAVESEVVASFGRDEDPRVTPYLLEQNPLEDAVSIEAATERFWAEQGDKSKQITTFSAFVEAKEQWEKAGNHKMVAVVGGGFGGMRIATEIRKIDPDAHIVIFERSPYIGGMAVNAISPFIESHGQTKISTFRSGLKLLTDPGVDVISNIELQDADVLRLSEELGFQVVVDARGSEPNELDVPYGDGVLSINDYLDMVNGPYDQDGHFGNVHVPWARKPNGSPMATLIVAGGNAGPDLQKANELALIVDELVRTRGIDPRTINIAKIAATGVRVVRQELGMATTELDHAAVSATNGKAPNTVVLYRGPLGMMDVSKRVKGMGSKKREDFELQQAILGKVSEWEAEDGGWYVGNREIVSVKRLKDGSLYVVLHDTSADPKEAKKDPALKNHSKDYAIQVGLVVGAVGFKKQPKITHHVGIRVHGKGDLAGTGETVREAKPDILSALSSVPALVGKDYATVLSRIHALQIENGTRYTDDTLVDPVLDQMKKAPKSLVAKGFRSPKKEIQVA